MTQKTKYIKIYKKNHTFEKQENLESWAAVDFSAVLSPEPDDEWEVSIPARTL